MPETDKPHNERSANQAPAGHVSPNHIMTPAGTIILHRTIAKERREKIAKKLNEEHISRMKNKKLVNPHKSFTVKIPGQAKTTSPSSHIIKLPTPSAKSVEKPTLVSSTPKITTQPTPIVAKDTKIRKPLPFKPTPATLRQNPYIVRFPAPVIKNSHQIKNEDILIAIASTDTSQTTETNTLHESFQQKVSPLKNRRFITAFFCSIVSVFCIGAFINANLPNLPARVAALQAGFDIKYPSYIPNGYQLSGITSDRSSKITIRLIKNEKHINITEEKSTWDSQSLLNNRVKKTWGNNYTTTRDQGLTIFLSKNSAIWVNGGILYSIDGNNDLDRIQLHNIIYSL